MSPEKAEELGKSVLAAVGLPLVKFGSVRALGATVAQMAVEARHVKDRAQRERKKKMRAEMEKIAAAAEGLATRLKQLTESLDGDTLENIRAARCGHSLANLEDVAMKLRLSAVIIDPRDLLLMRIDSLEMLIGEKLVIQFEVMFGEKSPKYRLDPIDQNYDGPFIRFARSVLDEAGIALSDEAIVKYLKRRKKTPREAPWFLQGPGPRDKY